MFSSKWVVLPLMLQMKKQQQQILSVVKATKMQSCKYFCISWWFVSKWPLSKLCRINGFPKNNLQRSGCWQFEMFRVKDCSKILHGTPFFPLHFTHGGSHSHTSLLSTCILPHLKWTLHGVSHHVTFAPLNSVTPVKQLQMAYELLIYGCWV